MLDVEPGPTPRVRTLWLNRPEARNAFDEALIEALHRQVDAAREDSLRVLLIRGRGSVFCAGGDLNWMRRAADQPPAQNEADALRLASLYRKISESPALVVCGVHGAAMGGGLGLVAAADVAIATDTACFSFSEVRLGLVPATISPYVLARIGAGHARALFSTGEVFHAERALRIGLVHQVTPEADLEAALLAVTRQALKAGPNAVAAAKRLTSQPPLSDVESSRLLGQTRATAEAREGLEAFLEKRHASFFEEF